MSVITAKRVRRFEPTARLAKVGGSPHPGDPVTSWRIVTDDGRVLGEARFTGAAWRAALERLEAEAGR